VFGSAQTGVLMGYQDFRSIALSAIISGILALPVYIFNSYYWGLEGTVMAMFIFSIFTNLINSLFIYKNCRTHHIRYSFFDAYKELPILWRSNFPVFLSTTIWSISIWLTQLMLASYSEGTSTLGIYYVVINYQMIMSFIPIQLRSVFFPTFSQLSNKKNSDQYWRVVKKSWLFNIVISLLVVFPFLLFPKFFMGIYDIEFIEGWYVLVIAGLSVIAISCSEIAYQIIKSHGKFWTDCIICTICMVLYVFIVHILLKSGYREVSLFYAIILTSSIGAMITMILIWNHRNKIGYI
jgi:O-antigen/teichoic acid export membrane protein